MLQHNSQASKAVANCDKVLKVTDTGNMEPEDQDISIVEINSTTANSMNSINNSTYSAETAGTAIQILNKCNQNNKKISQNQQDA